ncbi:MAG: hypothetical protein HY308_14520 [Gammaproteobacteria bacterium]|nr:hypothetical protein [Gammaproteobacteria bacterium]
MDDIAAVLRIIVKHKGKLLAIGLLLSLWLFAYPRAHLDSVEVSPDRTYRLEFYRPGLLQHFLNREKSSPGFVRLYRNFDNEYFGESDVFDCFGATCDIILAHGD